MSWTDSVTAEYKLHEHVQYAYNTLQKYRQREKDQSSDDAVIAEKWSRLASEIKPLSNLSLLLM